MCGIAGVYNKENVSYSLFEAGRQLQHRGQESFGILTFDQIPYIKKAPGKISEGLSEEMLNSLRGDTGLVHLRYPTVGDQSTVESILHNESPFYTLDPFFIAMVQNGDMPKENYEYLRSKSEREPISDSDVEVILNYFADELKYIKGYNRLEKKHIVEAARNTIEDIKGGESIIGLIYYKNEKIMFAFTDKKKIRPLVAGKKGDSYIFASETPALDVLGYEYLHYLKGGEVDIVDSSGLERFLPENPVKPAHCFFEWTYFARPDSIIEEVPIYDVRYKLGRKLAKKDKKIIENGKLDIVVPVLHSGGKYAIGYHDESGLPLVEALYKNEYIGRTFIKPPGQRKKNVRVKQNPIRHLIEGKRIVLVDDSIVRGTTMRRTVNVLRESGAKEIHVRIGTPPIISKCEFGIDMKTNDQFIARNKSFEEIAGEIGADSVIYTSIEDLIESIGKGADELCLGCLTGKYPYELKI